MEKINMACMVHNAYWFSAEKFANSLDCNIDVFGNSMYYFYHRADFDEKNYNILILFSAQPYSSLEENMLNECSNLLIERGVDLVTTAYLHVIPESERVDDNTDKVMLIRQNAKDKDEKSFKVDTNYDIIDLINDTVQFYNERMSVEQSPVKKLES